MKNIVRYLSTLPKHLISDGYDEALKYLKGILPLKTHTFPTDMKIYDWVIPEKWTVEEAYVEDSNKVRLIDINKSPLHLISYSLSFNGRVSREELLRHLHSDSKRRNAIPYLAKYYERSWGFCVPHAWLERFSDKEYYVRIKSKFTPGKLKVGEAVIRGKHKSSVFLMAHLCHPVQANDNASGVAVIASVYRELIKRKAQHRHTYRFLFVPETIGPLAYLFENQDCLANYFGGFYISMVGHKAPLVLKHSFNPNAKVDRIAHYVLSQNNSSLEEFDLGDSSCTEEKIFNDPSFHIPVITLTRGCAKKEIYKYYPEYHSSLDTIKIIEQKSLEETVQKILQMIDILEHDIVPVKKIKGPFFMSKHKIYIDWNNEPRAHQYSKQILYNIDGKNSIFEICERFGIPFDWANDFLFKLSKKKLIKYKDIGS